MPRLLASQYAHILFRLTEKKEGEALDVVIRVFADYLQKEGALSKIQDIKIAFEAICERAEGKKRLLVSTARPLAHAAQKAIAEAFGVGAHITETTNPKMLGGIIIQDQYTVIDASIRGQLDRFSHRIQ